MISRIGGPAKNILSKDSCIYLDEKNVSKGGARFWSDRGCRVDKIETNATHIVCKCNHLTDFGSRLIGSLASSIDVVGQLGGTSEELLAKASANMGTIFIMVGLLVFTCMLCGLGTFLEYTRKTNAKIMALRLTSQLSFKAEHGDKRTIKDLELLLFKKSTKKLAKMPTNIAIDKESKKESQKHVVGGMCRHFWTDAPLNQLKLALKQSRPPSTLQVKKRSSIHSVSLNALKRKGTGNDSVDENNNKNETAKFKGNTDTDTDTDDRMIYRNNPMLFDDDDKPAKEVQKDGVRQCFCVSLYKRIWQQCKDGMSVQHEWLSPFTLNAETAHFTPAMRIILLVFVLLSEILCEALLYDLYNPDQAGTCSIVNVNLTSSMSPTRPT